MITSYDSDFASWAIETAGALRARRLDDVNIDAVAEEIESLGKSNLREMESRIGQILEHRLKLDLVQGLVLEHNRRGWTASIGRQRNALASLFKQSPSLRGAMTDDLGGSAISVGSQDRGDRVRRDATDDMPLYRQERLPGLAHACRQ